MGFSRQEYQSGFHFLLQGIFPTQGLNLGLPHCGQTLYPLSHQGRRWCGIDKTGLGSDNGEKSGDDNGADGAAGGADGDKTG